MRGRNGPSAALSRPARDDVALDQIFDVLRGASGVDFSEYKVATVQRRLAHRLSFNGVATLPEYLAFLLEDPNEVRQLYEGILVHVTSFFRDAEVFEALARRHGAEAVQAWAAELTGASGRVTPIALSDSVRRHFGESLDALLRDP